MDFGILSTALQFLSMTLGVETFHRLRLPLVCKAFRDLPRYRDECVRLNLISSKTKDSLVNPREIFLKKMITDAARKKAKRYALEGKNLFVTGSAGTGKTHLVTEIMNSLYKKYYSRIQDNPYFIGNSSTTASSAMIVSTEKMPAYTIHSLLGLGIKFHSDANPTQSVAGFAWDKYCKDKKDRNFAFKKKRLCSIGILRIDEIGMLSCRAVWFFSEYLKLIRNNPKPFGGIQLIVSGDFGQFRPIPDKVGTEEVPFTKEFCFEWPDFWNAFPKDQVINLLYSYRQKDDPEFAGILERARQGVFSKSDIKTLNKRTITPEKIKKIPDFDSILKVFPKRIQVDVENKKYLDGIKGEERTFETKMILFNPTTGLSIPVPPLIASKHKRTLVLKTGCKVVITKNIDQARGIVNGAFCVVDHFHKDTGFPVLRLNNKNLYYMTAYEMEHAYPEGKLVVSEVRLEPAYAMTIHRTQGMTVPRIVADLGESAFDSAVYTLLSRVGRIEDVYLLKFLPEKLVADPVVVEFYRSISPLAPKSASHKGFPTSEDLKHAIDKYVDSKKEGKSQSVLKFRKVENQ